MKIITVFLLGMFASISADAQQKPIIDTGMLNIWPYISGDAILSKDGRYAAFTISNQPIGSNTLVIQDVSKNWKREIVSSEIGYDFYFSRDSKTFCWQNGDSLLLQLTGRDEIKLLAIVSLYKFPRLNKGEWIAYRSVGEQGITLLNLITQRRMVFRDAKDIYFNELGNTALIESSGKQNNLQWIDLKSQKIKTIWTGNEISKTDCYQFDREGEQLAFIVNELSTTSVYYYKEGAENANKRLDNHSSILKGNFEISKVSGFSVNGKWLFIKISKPKPKDQKPEPNMVSVDVWSYRDEVVNPAQVFFPRKNTTIDLVMAVSGNDEGILLNPDGLIAKRPDEVTGDYSILSSDTIPHREYWWPHSPKPSEWLVSLKDGSRQLLLKERGDFILYFSPNGRWITWWDKDEGVLMDYDISTGQTHNINNTMPFTLATDAEYHAATYNQFISPQVAGWYERDSALLIYDNYDIWKVDPACQKPPVNITGGYGRNKKTELRIINQFDDFFYPLVYKGNETILLYGYNRESKHNGFLGVTLDRPGRTKDWNIGPFIWYRSPDIVMAGMQPAAGGRGRGKGWIVMRESATEYPNYFYTKDFKKFRALTELAPQKKYNWLTSELVPWTLPDGRASQGILYKPENFDPTKKYPVIFNYYEKHSYRMYEFRYPGLTDGDINIPYFVSRGYLVFQPDIYYGNSSKTGVTSGQYALQALESAADDLIKRPYIDATRLAIQGVSFGGLETNYILTHSNKFAAAAEGCGFTDGVSNYLSLVGVRIRTVDVNGIQSSVERGHQMYGATIWERPDLYLNNSPVLSADKAKSPILIFHNKDDEQVPWRQGVEMYMALRRLGKPCWMLQYDKSNHGLNQQTGDALDYTIRLTQFFDHYLKHSPAPRWMTQGVPASLKQIENRYDLDPTGNCSKDCKVCKLWNERDGRM